MGLVDCLGKSVQAGKLSAAVEVGVLVGERECVAKTQDPVVVREAVR